MSAFFVRSLVLDCSLVLAFPPDWCCLLPDGTIEPITLQPKTACCPSHKADPPHTPAERTPPLKDCCCSPLPSQLPSSGETFHPDLTFISAPVLDRDGPSARGSGEIVGYALFSSPS